MSLHRPPLQRHRPAGAAQPIDQFAEVRERVHRTVIETLGTGLLATQADEEVLAEQLHAIVDAALAQEETPLSARRPRAARTQITDEVVGYGPLERFLKDETVTEIMVNNHREIYIERGGRIFPTDVQFANEAHLRRILDKIVAQVGRRIDESSAMVDARLPDGSRVNAIIPPLSLNGPAMTIRKFAPAPARPCTTWSALGTISAGDGRLPRPVRAGPAEHPGHRAARASGKTTLLNVLSSFIPDDERIVTIEDAAELKLDQRHWLRLESRPAERRGHRAR